MIKGYSYIYYVSNTVNKTTKIYIIPLAIDDKKL